MTSSFKEIVSEINEGKWQKLYLLIGDEPYQVELIIEKLKKLFNISINQNHFNYISLSGDEVESEELYQTLNTVPSFFDNPDEIKMIICRNVESLSLQSLSILNQYVANPYKNNCLIMISPNLDKRKYKDLFEKCCIVHVTEPTRAEWNIWKKHFEKKISKEIEYEAWFLLLEKSNYKLALVWSELQKAVSYLGNSLKVSHNDILEILGFHENADVFSFVEDFIYKRTYNFNKKYHLLINDGESALKFISLLVRQFRLIDKIKRLTSIGITDYKILSSKLGLPFFVVSKLMEQAKIIDSNEISQKIQELAKCDFMLKTGRGDFWASFLMLC